eukprot:12425-Eustigmatos_ZCMA.PRE.1
MPMLSETEFTIATHSNGTDCLRSPFECTSKWGPGHSLCVSEQPKVLCLQTSYDMTAETQVELT